MDGYVSCRPAAIRAKTTGEERKGLAESNSGPSDRRVEGTEERMKERLRDELTNQAEAARTRGTPLTPETFQTWRKQFTSELKQKREKEEEERIKALPPREREDVKKRRERLSGGSFLSFCFTAYPISDHTLPDCRRGGTISSDRHLPDILPTLPPSRIPHTHIS